MKFEQLDYEDENLRCHSRLKPVFIDPDNPPSYPPMLPEDARCSPTCMGWDHFDDPYEIERCDDCGRFSSDDEAILAHRDECGCAWPEYDPDRHMSSAPCPQCYREMKGVGFLHEGDIICGVCHDYFNVKKRRENGTLALHLRVDLTLGHGTSSPGLLHEEGLGLVGS